MNFGGAFSQLNRHKFQILFEIKSLPKLTHAITQTSTFYTAHALCYPTQVEISSPNLVFNSLKFYRHVDGMKSADA